MDDADLRRRLWEGFAGLQTLLGGSARNGFVLEWDGLVASIVPSAPDSPALNAAVAIDPAAAPDALEELEVRYGDAGVRRWAIWVDGSARDVTAELRSAGLAIASASPGMGAELDSLAIDLTTTNPRPNAGLMTHGPATTPPPGSQPAAPRGAEDRRPRQRPRLRECRQPPGADADDAAGGCAARLPRRP